MEVVAAQQCDVLNATDLYTLKIVHFVCSLAQFFKKALKITVTLISSVHRSVALICVHVYVLLSGSDSWQP